jgi:predicted nucleic acid-binding protein
MKYILDTSAYSAFNRGDTRLKSVFAPNNELLVPLIVIGELRAGFACGNQLERNEALLKKLLNQSNVSVLVPTEATTTQYSHIFAYLRYIGRPCGTNDIWIAALAREHNLTLVTMDADFHAVENLAVFQLPET